MRVSVRLILSLVGAVTLVTFLFARSEVRAEKNGLRSDLERRAEVLAESLQEVIGPLEANGPHTLSQQRHLQQMVERFGNRERLAGVAVYDAQGRLLAISSRLAQQLALDTTVANKIAGQSREGGEFLQVGATAMHVFVMPLVGDDGLAGKLVIFHDASYIEAQSLEIWRHAVWHGLVQVLLITLITLLIVRWSIVGPIAKTAQWVREMRAGRKSPPPDVAAADIIGSLSHEVVNIAHSLATARAAAEEEARLREAGESLWTSDRLRIHIQTKLQGGRLFVISNREPCEHVVGDKGIEVVVPASGLVTASSRCSLLATVPGSRTAAGTPTRKWWTSTTACAFLQIIRNIRCVGCGSAARKQDGYYYGFSNEGLWPLCHIAHTRPIFREADWTYYQSVNQQVCRRSARGNGRDRRAAPAGSGLSLRSVAAANERGTPGRTSWHLLAHSVAESRSLRHLPVAARITGWATGRRPHRLPDPVPLQLLSGDG